MADVGGNNSNNIDKAFMESMMDRLDKMMKQQSEERHQRKLEAELAEKARVMCQRLKARNQRFEAKMQQQARAKEEQKSEPWRSNPREHMNDKLKQPRGYVSTLFSQPKQKKDVPKTVEKQSVLSQDVLCKPKEKSEPHNNSKTSNKEQGKMSLSSRHSEINKHNVCDKLKQNPKSPTVLNENVHSKEIATTHSNSVVHAGEIKQTLHYKPHVLKFAYKETLVSLANPEPVLPSRVLTVLQDFEDNNPGGLPQVYGLEHQVVAEPGAPIKTFLYAIINQQDCSDLRSNPFQVGEDDMIKASTKEEQLKPVHDAELVAEEAKHESSSKVKYWISTTTTTIFDPGIARKRTSIGFVNHLCALFPCLRFCPTGFCEDRFLTRPNDSPSFQPNCCDLNHGPSPTKPHFRGS